MSRNRIMMVVGVLLIVSMVLGACAPTTTPQVPGPTDVPVVPVVPAEPKVMVACLAQEPSTLYTFSEAALVKTFILEALYDNTFDARSYDYQPVMYTDLATFDNGGSTKNTLEVGVGDTVYDSALDEAVVLAAGMIISLNQAEGDPVEVTVAEGTKYPVVQIVSTFTIVTGVTWEDGTPVTTADILFAYEVGASPDTPSAKYFYTTQTQKLEAVDAQSYNYFFMPGYTSGTYFVDGMIAPLPKHVYGEGGSRPLTPAEMLADEEVNRHPLSYGPFKLVEWVAGDHITVEKNPTYWRANEGLPILDTLIYRFVPDTNQLIAQLASGECDLGTQDAAFEGSLPLIRQFEAEGLMVPQVVAGTVFEHLDFNTSPVDSYTGAAATLKANDGTPLFAKKEFHQAIAYCLDRQAIVDLTTNGAAVVQHTYTASDHPLYAGDANITIYEFNPTKGLEMLAALGWTDTNADGILDDGQGNPLSFIHSTRNNALRQKVTQVVQSQLKTNCNIETTIELYGSEFFADGPDGVVFGRAFDLSEFAWLTGVEPPCTLYISSQVPNEVNGWGASNDPGFMNADFDAACNAAVQALDPATKAAQHTLAQQVFTEFLPSIPLFARAKILVTGPNIVGVIMDPTANSEFWNVENFDILP
jgi:peptide/nickel transport system substrate-binding protein